MLAGEDIGKPKKQRACDFCRRRKTKCDGANMPMNICSACISNRHLCMYTQAAEKRTPPEGYVLALEDRVKKMDVLLKKLYPGGDYMQALEIDADDGKRVLSKPAPSLDGLVLPSAPHPSLLCAHKDLGDESSDDDVPSFLTVALDKPTPGPTPRYFGKSSNTGIFKRVVEKKTALMNKPPKQDARRPVYWRINPWEIMKHDTSTSRTYIFPEPDLLHTLINAYFTEINILWPLLHRPTFENSVAEGLHHKDSGFAGVVLLVCATGSRFVSDPRVLSDSSSLLSAGWKYFNQVQIGENALLEPPSLFNLQTRCLAVAFLQGSSVPQTCWLIIGVGIRLAQDVGAHRRKVYGSKPSVVREQWIRVFWCLVLFDRFCSSILGRACAIHDEDFDLEFPTQCDDEFWESSAFGKPFEQPKNRPSSISFFIWDLRLQYIVSFALRTVYSINKSKVALGLVGREWETKVVGMVEAALDQWLNNMPEHIRWDPERTDDLFFHQSAVLRCAYYSVQMMVYRPFIAYPEKSPLRRPAIEICTSAARECSQVLEVHQRRRNTPLPLQLGPALTAAVVLLTRIWGMKRSGTTDDKFDQDMKYVHVCMDVLKRLETQWHIAGRLGDDLRELVNVDEAPSSPSANMASSDTDRLGALFGTSVSPNVVAISGTDVTPHEELHGHSVVPDLPHTRPRNPPDFGSPNMENTFGFTFEWPPSELGAWSSDAAWEPPTHLPINTEGPTMSNDEVTAWMSAPLSWQTNEWDSWMTGMTDAE